jgi:hypothetical protein
VGEREPREGRHGAVRDASGRPRYEVG